jgi:hypothetical protein
VYVGKRTDLVAASRVSLVDVSQRLVLQVIFSAKSWQIFAHVKESEVHFAARLT